MDREDVVTIPPEVLGRLASYGRTQTYTRNEFVLTEGETGDCLYILVSGQLKVFTKDERDRELVFSILREGMMFGEMFLDGGARSASVKAISDAQCIAIESSRIHELIRDEPDFADLLIRSLIVRLRAVSQLTKSLAMDCVYERVLDLLHRIAVSDGDARVIPAGMTQQEIADRVGATREMINHVIQGLIKRGTLRRGVNKRLVFTE